MRHKQMSKNKFQFQREIFIVADYHALELEDGTDEAILGGLDRGEGVLGRGVGDALSQFELGMVDAENQRQVLRL